MRDTPTERKTLFHNPQSSIMLPRLHRRTPSMASIPKKVTERIHSRLKHFQSVLAAQKARDVSEADTVTVIKDVLCDIFGFDKYAELTSEHSIRGTYCDLAIKLDGKVQLLLEVKAIGLELKDSHIKQAVDYAANQGIEWVVLSNGIEWVLFHVLFKKPIDKEEVVRINLCEVSSRNQQDMDRLFLLTKEGLARNALAEYRDRKDATSRFMLAAIILNSDSVLSAIRREVRRVSEIMVDEETVQKVLREQVLKREAIEGVQAETASRRLGRLQAGKRQQSTDAPVRVLHPGTASIADASRPSAAPASD
jgi:predicted type IV restriction endonuclease